MAILLVIILKWNFVGGIAWMEKQEEGRMCWKEGWDRKGICRACEVSWGKGGWRKESAESQDCGKYWRWCCNNRDQLSKAAPFWFHLLSLMGLIHPLEFLISRLVAALCSGRREKENKVPLTENCSRGVERGELQYSHEHCAVCEHNLCCLLSWKFVLLFLG